MASEWPLVTVGELAKSISDTHKMDKEHLIFLNTSDILLGNVLHRTYTLVRDWPGQAKKSIRRDDILFSEIRPANGRWAFIDFEADDYVVSTKLMVIRGDKNRVVPRFLYHFLTSAETTRWLQHLAESRSGTFPQITFDQVAELEIALPPLDAQTAIAKFLDDIEEKIELNRRMNETLEAMARALFKSWFVDFLPVRANMAVKALPVRRTQTGNDPSLLLPQAEPGTWYVYAIECNDGSLYIGQTEDLRQRWLQHVGGKGASWTKQHPPVRVPYWEKQPSREAAVERENWLKTGYGRKWLKQEIAARTQTGDPLPASVGQAGGLPNEIIDLFPSRLVDSELGKIPEGWEVGTLADMSALNPEVWSEKTRPSEINYVDLSGAKWGRIESVVVHQKADAPSRAQRVLRPGDTIVGTVRPGNGSYAFIGEAELTGSTGFAVLRPTRSEYAAFVYLAATAPENIELLSHLSDGGAYPAVRPEVVAATQILRSTDQVLNRFANATRFLFERMSQNERESRILAAIRDALLPKLISGELQLKGIRLAGVY